MITIISLSYNRLFLWVCNSQKGVVGWVWLRVSLTGCYQKVAGLAQQGAAGYRAPLHITLGHLHNSPAHSLSMGLVWTPGFHTAWELRAAGLHTWRRMASRPQRSHSIPTATFYPPQARHNPSRMEGEGTALHLLMRKRHGSVSTGGMAELTEATCGQEHPLQGRITQPPLQRIELTGKTGASKTDLTWNPRLVPPGHTEYLWLLRVLNH